MNETIKRTCSLDTCSKPFLVIAKEQQFYERKGLPFPSLCPACRHKQRMALRGERELYKRECAHCHTSMLSTYPTSSPYTIYCQTCFWENIG